MWIQIPRETKLFNILNIIRDVIQQVVWHFIKSSFTPNLSQTIRSTEIETGSTPFIIARVIRVFFLHFAWVIRDDREKRKSSGKLAFSRTVSSSPASSLGKNDDANRRGGVSEDCGHIRWTVRRSFKSLSCAYKSTSEREHVTQVPWPIKLGISIARHYTGAYVKRFIGGCAYVL